MSDLAGIRGQFPPASWLPVRLTTVRAMGLMGRSAQTQGLRLDVALADSGVGKPRCSRSMRVRRRDSSRSWPVMTVCSWASEMATG